MPIGLDVEREVALALEPQAHEPQPHCYGDRAGRFRDPYGHVWIVATRIEEVPPDEMQRRMERLFEG